MLKKTKFSHNNAPVVLPKGVLVRGSSLRHSAFRVVEHGITSTSCEPHEEHGSHCVVDVDDAAAVMYSPIAQETGGNVGEGVVDGVGAAEGALVVGVADGAAVDGATVGIVVGEVVEGASVGVNDGAAVEGAWVGVIVGDAVVGAALGVADSEAVVGEMLGVAVGDALVGTVVGLAEGAWVVGTSVGGSVCDVVVGGARVVSGSPDPPPDPLLPT